MQYLTLVDSIRQNGNRHLANAIGYASAGLPRHSDGSLRKAMRNLSKADSFTIPPWLDGLADQLACAVADTILTAHG
jgi:hypothetical protein